MGYELWVMGATCNVPPLVYHARLGVLGGWVGLVAWSGAGLSSKAKS